MAETANGGLGVSSTSPTTWLSWTWPPVTAKFSGRPLLSRTMAWILRRATAAADADRLLLLPPFAPLAARWAFMIVLSIRYRLSRDFEPLRRVRNPLPDTAPRPTVEAIVRRCVGSVAFRRSRHGIPVRNT